MKNIILFDGECHFCDQSVQFIIKRDPHGYFHFASLQSEIGIELLRDNNASKDLDSIVLVENNKYYFESSAVLRICKQLKGAWKLLYVLTIIPKPLRDYIYKIIAKNRYRWFGKKDNCELPSPEVRDRFL